ncbi:hypothetical protein BHM03_00022434 [Ensete ventricosum]|nr:hypothetical protein BHM03_00022434 [Ensete ventricosum]
MEEEMFLRGAMGAGSMERAFSRVRAPRKERAREMWRVVSDARTVAGVEMPVCARPPASQSLRRRAELVRMSGDSGIGSGVLMLEWRSPGEEGIVLLGSAAGSCKEVGSGRFPT